LIGSGVVEVAEPVTLPLSIAIVLAVNPSI
jgi:hypothetical protein